VQEYKEVLGKKPGPTSVILAGVHGNELPGIKVIIKMMRTLRVKRGRVLLVLGNPNAIASGKRKTEQNLNRMFRKKRLLTNEERLSYEGLRATYIKSFLNQADALLDVHASETKKTRPFVICESNGFGIAKHLPFGLIVSGFDKVSPGGTDEYMNLKGKLGLCVECGYIKDPKAVRRADTAIRSFLAAMGHIPFPKHHKPRVQKRMRLRSIYHNQEAPFKLAKPWDDFETIRRGTIVGMDGKNPVRAKKDFVIIFPDNCNTVGEEAFYLAYEE
jgi:succinylglutamate desuccinylase